MTDAPAPPKTRRLFIWIALSVVLALVIYTQLTLFVVQPIGAVPDGRTLLIRQTGKLHFIDSADAVCAREHDGVSLLCRGVILGAVAKNSSILARLPYSRTLYLISTDGKDYSK